MQTVKAPDAPLPDDARSLHVDLAHWNHRRLAPMTPDEADDDPGLALRECAFIDGARAAVAARAADAPSDAGGFVRWYERLKQTGPGQGDALFPWLATTASFEDMRWFIAQEAAGEAGFDDLLALTLVRMPVQAKLELARNFFDEMGRGNAMGMHGPMLATLVHALDLSPTIEATLTPSLALGNTMVALATRRPFAYHAIGALGVIELTAPDRATAVAAGLKRLGVSAEARRYFDLHATLDIRHSEAWNREVIAPLVEARPECARFIAEGALMRLSCGAACFDAYRAHLWR